MATTLDSTDNQPVAGAGDLPSGTLTFLMTDIEGSTPLWERHEALMRETLRRHDALLAACIDQAGGRLVRERGEGDSIFAVFTDPAQAVIAAVAIQRALLAEPWPPETPLRARIGMYTGDAALRERNYYGPAINRCARVRGLGHGSQIVVAAGTAALAAARLPADVTLRSLGAHSLKGVERPEEVFQVLHPALPADFPPLLSPQAPRTNLPVAPVALVGREREQAEVAALLVGAALVTLTGVGGTGKTRLALAVAGELVDQYADGVWLVELAAVADGALVPAALALALGVREETNRPLTATLADHLRARRALLLLDNCEHLLAASAALVSALLHACQGVRILATSREGLELAGERLYPVPPLAVPDPTRLPSLESLAENAAVRLFVERAQARRADFALTAATAPHVARICARLDGIPLAIELAAARIAVLGVAQIAARLDRNFQLLTGGPRTALPHHQTLHAALDWSHDLLDDRERAIFAWLATFAGGWRLDAAERVCAADDAEEWEILDLLAGLVRKSLVLPLEREDGEMRYRLLEPVRDFALEKLAASGSAAAARDQHLAWCLALAEEADRRLRGAEQARWLDRLEEDHDNLRAALRWSMGEASRAAAGARLAGHLWWFWQMRGYITEGRAWLDGVLAQAEGVPAEALVVALSGAGVLARDQDDYQRARHYHERCLALQRQLGNRRGIAGALGNLGNVFHDMGDVAAAGRLHQECLAVMRELGDHWGIAMALLNVGYVALERRQYEEARAGLEESVSIMRDLDNRQGIANALDMLGLVRQLQGDYQQARSLHDESLILRRELGDKHGIAASLANLASARRHLGDQRAALLQVQEGLAIFHDIGEKGPMLECLETVALITAARDRDVERAMGAAHIVGAIDALRAEIGGSPLSDADANELSRLVVHLVIVLGETRFAQARAAGQAMPLAAAIELALGLRTDGALESGEERAPDVRSSPGAGD